jgi:orotate phosphoribosyltransferase
MTALQFEKLFTEAGAIITGDHFAYSLKADGIWRHGDAYFDKRSISSALLLQCAEEMTRRLHSLDLVSSLDYVIAPEKGAIPWGKALTNVLIQTNSRIVFVPAVKDFYDAENPVKFRFEFPSISCSELQDKNFIAAEDVINPGTSILKVVMKAESFGGKAAGICVLCNRAGKEGQNFLSPYLLLTMLEYKMDMHQANECPYCKIGRQMNTKLGRGKEWLATPEGQAWLALQR